MHERDRRSLTLAIVVGLVLLVVPVMTPTVSAQEEGEEIDCDSCHVSVGESDGQVCVTVVCDGKPTGGATVTGSGQVCTTDGVTGQCCLNLGEGSHTIVVSIPGCDPIIRNVKVDKSCCGDISVVPIPVAGGTSVIGLTDLENYTATIYHDGIELPAEPPSSLSMKVAFTDHDGDGILTGTVRSYSAIYPESQNALMRVPEIRSTLDTREKSFLFFNPYDGSVRGEIWTVPDSSIFLDDTQVLIQFEGTWDGASHVTFCTASRVTEGGLSLPSIQNATQAGSGSVE